MPRLSYLRKTPAQCTYTSYSVGWSERTSGKSTQKAFIFMPYKKLAKLSLNLLRLSCINCRCMKLASKSAMESDNSAKAGSSESSGKAAFPDLGVKDWLSRSEVRELGRKGVEGRDGGFARVTEVERLGLLMSMFLFQRDVPCKYSVLHFRGIDGTFAWSDRLRHQSFLLCFAHAVGIDNPARGTVLHSKYLIERRR